MSYAIVLLTSYESLKQSKRINTLSVVIASLQLNLSTSGIAAGKLMFIVIKFQPNLLKRFLLTSRGQLNKIFKVWASLIREYHFI